MSIRKVIECRIDGVNKFASRLLRADRDAVEFSKRQLPCIVRLNVKAPIRRVDTKLRHLAGHDKKAVAIFLVEMGIDAPDYGWSMREPGGDAEGSPRGIAQNVSVRQLVVLKLRNDMQFNARAGRAEFFNWNVERWDFRRTYQL